MDKDKKPANLRQAMNDYRIAVLIGLRNDRCDGCWQRAVLAMPFLFDRSLVERSMREIEMDSKDRPGSK